MSLILGSLLIGAGSAIIGRFLVKRRLDAAEAALASAKEAKVAKDEKKKPEVDKDEEAAMAEVEAEVPTAKDSEPRAIEEAVTKPRKGKGKALVPKPGEGHRLDGFLCQLGDVLTRITGEEAWLAGAVVLSEDIPVAVLFVAPDAGHDCAIYVRPHPRPSLFWLEPLDPSAVLVGGEPPSSVEHGGIRFDRARRLPLRPRRIGVGAPDVGDGVMVAEYASGGSERLLVLKSNSGDVRAYRGLELEEGTYEVIASGDSTL